MSGVARESRSPLDPRAVSVAPAVLRAPLLQRDFCAVAIPRLFRAMFSLACFCRRADERSAVVVPG
eukprot:11223432-Lingulodinium_polyedra.AAC.1